MLTGKRVVVALIIIVCAVPVIVLTRIYTNFSGAGSDSFSVGDPHVLSDVSSRHLLSSPSEHPDREDGGEAPEKVVPPELQDLVQVLADVEKSMEGADKAIPNEEVERANTLIAEMDELISRVGMGLDRTDEESLQDTMDEIGSIQKKLDELVMELE